MSLCLFDCLFAFLALFPLLLACRCGVDWPTRQTIAMLLVPMQSERHTASLHTEGEPHTRIVQRERERNRLAKMRPLGSLSSTTTWLLQVATANAKCAANSFAIHRPPSDHQRTATTATTTTTTNTISYHYHRPLPLVKLKSQPRIRANKTRLLNLLLFFNFNSGRFFNKRIALRPFVALPFVLPLCLVRFVDG